MTSVSCRLDLFMPSRAPRSIMLFSKPLTLVTNTSVAQTFHEVHVGPAACSVVRITGLNLSPYIAEVRTHRCTTNFWPGAASAMRRSSWVGYLEPMLGAVKEVLHAMPARMVAVLSRGREGAGGAASAACSLGYQPDRT